MLSFDKKILFVGYGAVAQCTLPILAKQVKMPLSNITVMDFEDKREVLAPWIKKGVNFVRDKVWRDNMGKLLGKYVGRGDLLIDLAWNIDCCEILDWCHEKGVLYINTSVEVWDPYEGAANKHPTERTLYWRHMNVRKLIAKWPEKSPTAVLEHGANPGLISHFKGQLPQADSSTACTTEGRVIAPISGSPPAPKNWQTMSPQALRAAGWRIVHESLKPVCQSAP